MSDDGVAKQGMEKRMREYTKTWDKNHVGGGGGVAWQARSGQV